MKKFAVRRVGVIALGIVIIAMMGLPQFGGSGDVPSISAQTAEIAASADTASSGIQIQNLGTAAANVQLEFWDQTSGTKVATISVASIAVGGNSTVYLPQKAEVPAGFRGSVVISSDQPVAAIAKTNWTPSKASSAYTGFKSAEAAGSFNMPLVLRNYFGQTSKLTVQNTGTTSASVTVKFYKSGQTAASLELTKAIAGGASYTWDQSAADEAGLGDGFIGSAVISSASPVAAVGDIFRGSAVYTYNGFAMGGSPLVAPLVRKNYYGSSGIQVQNIGTAATTVKITYVGKINNAGSNMTFTDQKSLNPSESTNFYVPQNAQIPDRFVGAATIESTGGVPIVAMVNDLVGDNSSAAYNSVATAQGTKTIQIPLVRNRHTGDQMTTGVQVANVGTTTANVKIKYSAGAGSPAPGTGQDEDSTQIAPGASATFYQGGPALDGGGTLPGGFLGSAVVTSDQNVLAIVNDISLINAWDASIFNGIGN